VTIIKLQCRPSGNLLAWRTIIQAVDAVHVLLYYGPRLGCDSVHDQTSFIAYVKLHFTTLFLLE